MDKETLKEVGLQDGEITLYLALLKLSDATATEIAQHTGVHRSHIYDLIEKLKEKGLVSFVIKNNVKYFTASHPSKLMDYIKEKEEKVAKIIPSLLDLSKGKKENIKVEIYKGKEGVKTILNDILREGQDYFLFGNLKFEELMPIYIEQFVKKADKKKITEKAILEVGTKIIPTKRHEYRYISKEYLFPNATCVYGDKVATFIWQEPYYVILTESKDISQSHKTHFNLIWKIAKK
jgi:HTH-type transcriptional regulator, sugar sensing transcriptional regulator